WWATSSRNGWATSNRNGGRDHLGILGDIDRNPQALVETHPAAGYDVLKGHVDISPEVLDAVRHHHEYLDGSGYPDRLCAENITDIVRILTISDIFAAHQLTDGHLLIPIGESRPARSRMHRAFARGRSSDRS
ncbi:hypothetical protein IVA85_08130, partial [Bradyrhizobium sp. 145]|nr:hypothetical protein [Bradyrhizobium sp. 145]